MDFYEVIRTRRSVRSFRPDPVPADILERVLDAARIAPSGSNRQPWTFVLVRDPDRKKTLAHLCNDQGFIATAPVVIVGCGRDIRYNRGGYMGPCSMLVDVAIAMDHLVLAARAEGLGACWIGSFDNSAIKRFLGIPDDVQVVALTPLGYPQGNPFEPTASRHPLGEIVREEQW